MKNIQILTFLIIIIIFVSFIQKSLNKNQDGDFQSTPTIPIAPSPIPAKKETSPTISLKIPTPTTIQNQNIPSADLSAYKYPNSQTEESSNSVLVLSSSDDPAKITEWYVNKLKNQGMNVNSFVKTSTNKNILNKLVSSNGAIKISITISKKNSDTITKIVIEV